MNTNPWLLRFQSHMKAVETLKVKRFLKQLTSSLGMHPDFLVIGAQKAGTTSLYKHLVAHPSVLSAKTKELHFFDYPWNYKKGVAWYRSHFPLKFWKYYYRLCLRKPCITGEASPYYLFHPHAAKRVASLLPRIKLIVLLRNPIDRAYSHYQHTVRRGKEDLSFEDAIQNEETRLKKEKELLLLDENYFSFEYQYYSYLARGIYWEQLERWFCYFPREQFLIIPSESFLKNPADVFPKVVRFLELPEYTLKSFNKYHTGSYSERPGQHVIRYLQDYFRPHNERLYRLLGVGYDW